MDPDNEGNSAVTVTGRTSDAPSTPGGTTAEPSGSAAAAADEADKKKCWHCPLLSCAFPDSQINAPGHVHCPAAF